MPWDGAAALGRESQGEDSGGWAPLAADGLEQVHQLDRQLFRLARGAGLLRLRMGQALERMGEGYQELGFSTLGAYAAERCSRRARWAQEARTLARRLEELPLLREALEAGDIGWSMAELLARNATPETEAALLDEALKKSVRAMRESLRLAAGNDDNGSARATASSDDLNDNDEDEQRKRTLTLSVPIEEAYMLDAVRRLFEHLEGRASTGDWFEALVAEGQNELMAHLRSGEALLPEDVVAQHAAWLARVEACEAQRRRDETRAEAQLPREACDLDALDGVPEEEDLPSDLLGLDLRLRQWSIELAARDLGFGRLVERFFSYDGWRALGYASETQYARERLGMSRAAMRGKLALARKTGWLEQTAEALERGAIGTEAAALIARVAGADTEGAWLERAARRTFKHLREEVEATEWLARLAPDTSVWERLPPSAEELAILQAAERDLLSGAALRRAGLDMTEASGDETDGAGASGAEADGAETDGDPTEASEAEVAAMSLADAIVQMSAFRRANRGASTSVRAYTTVRIRVDEEVALWFRQLEEAFRRRAPQQSFIRFMCLSFFRSWTHQLGHSDKWEAVYRRDGYRCTCPVCGRRSVTLHHIEYRSRGGGDEHENLTSPCELCRYRHKLHYAACRIMPTLMAA